MTEHIENHWPVQVYGVTSEGALECISEFEDMVLASNFMDTMFEMRVVSRPTLSAGVIPEGRTASELRASDLEASPLGEKYAQADRFETFFLTRKYSYSQTWFAKGARIVR